MSVDSVDGNFKLGRWRVQSWFEREARYGSIKLSVFWHFPQLIDYIIYVYRIDSARKCALQWSEGEQGQIKSGFNSQYRAHALKEWQHMSSEKFNQGLSTSTNVLVNSEDLHPKDADLLSCNDVRNFWQSWIQKQKKGEQPIPKNHEKPWIIMDSTSIL